MALIGRALLILGLTVAIYGVGASVYGGRTGRREWVDSGRRSMYALFGLMALAFGILEWAFLSDKFEFNIVAHGSSTSTPTQYKAAAVWATQQGSLLLWILLLSLWSSLVLFLSRRKVREIAPYATAVLLGFSTFFTALCVFFANPFATSANPPTEGAGLDPLLRHTTMMIHPPFLYSGYTMLTIPFAFAVGALITGRTSAEWIQVTRRFALAAWLFLGVGIMLGARWSYTELGWGGYSGLGSGRERRPDAMVARHRLPALDHDSGKARDAEALEHGADPGHRHDGDRGDVPRPLGDPVLRSTHLSRTRRSTSPSWP